MDDEPCIMISLRQVEERKANNLIKNPKVLAVPACLCFDEDGTSLSRLREIWGLPPSIEYESHITLAVSDWNEKIVSLK